jgi:hypothetical protein
VGAALVVGVAAALAVGGYLIGAESSEENCAEGDVRVDGNCAAVRPGTPVDDTTAPVEHIASVLIDSDPAAGTLTGRCSFQGVAGRRVDVYLCLMSFLDTPITFRILHDRDRPIYHWRVLSDPRPRRPTVTYPRFREGESGRCTYRDQFPDCG